MSRMACDMVHEIVFSFKPSLLGSFDNPQTPIADQSGVILLQRGNALVGIWDAQGCGFSHPANQKELEGEALAAILVAYPNAETVSSDLRVFTCPKEIYERFNWGSTDNRP